MITNRHTDRNAERQAYGQADRHGCRQTGVLIDRHENRSDKNTARQAYRPVCM